MLGMNTMAWSPEEQRLLEQALKTYPVSTPDRWDRIAECVPNRTKKDCMRRYKVRALHYVQQKVRGLCRGSFKHHISQSVACGCIIMGFNVAFSL